MKKMFRVALLGPVRLWTRFRVDNSTREIGFEIKTRKKLYEWVLSIATYED